MQCIDRGMTKQEIIIRFEQDEQLVNMWISYLRGNRWIEHDKGGKLMMTDKAKEWLLEHPR